MYYQLDKKSEKLKDIWIKLAEKMEGIVKVGAVNCQNNEDICKENNINRYPTILCFPSDSSQPAIKYKIRKSVKRLADFAVKHMENYVQIINDDNFD